VEEYSQPKSGKNQVHLVINPEALQKFVRKFCHFRTTFFRTNWRCTLHLQACWCLGFCMIITNKQTT